MKRRIWMIVVTVSLCFALSGFAESVSTVRILQRIPYPSGTVESDFSFRNDIHWGDSEEAFLSAMEEEGYPGMSVYEQIINNDAAYANDIGKKEIWVEFVQNVPVADGSMTARLFATGTKKYGLHQMTYQIQAEESDAYDKALELTAFLEAEYGELKSSGENASYKAWKYTDDSSMIYLYILETSKYHVVIEFRHPAFKDIEETLIGGSYYADLE